MTRTAFAALSLATFTSLASAGSAVAQDYGSMSCGQLWYERNAIFAENGFCFKTRQAIATFGQGCFPPYGKLSRAESREVEEIRRWERRKGCA